MKPIQTTMKKKPTWDIKPITAGDIKRRHPRYLTCQTDKAYASLANDIFKLLERDL